MASPAQRLDNPPSHIPGLGHFAASQEPRMARLRVLDLSPGYVSSSPFAQVHYFHYEPLAAMTPLMVLFAVAVLNFAYQSLDRHSVIPCRPPGVHDAEVYGPVPPQSIATSLSSYHQSPSPVKASVPTCVDPGHVPEPGQVSHSTQR
ncbi:uncharacterized protein LAESUDRAFT_723520 [Laetiporus sulphureus 93-53]|uniref:Uncharacterized protein n=1 Tax=Laetiporus sulphureus 93-53 TaxID=1314785 RepID=A0A165F9J6_9APHY|nr:uncharacterized protein LAESUDRAFT_723520 [Laetiporus sulphureus 93-53]KZT08635.1 hypothetical protein LAESUDRAFT_723520 [Laetiporus sulphureus 93-53]